MLELKKFQEIFLAYLDQHPFSKDPIHLYDPIDYILSLGGKRLRPSMVLMGCALFSDDISKALPAAMGVEVFHNFSLVHDDIMDEAPLRRGNPTVHTKYDLNTAILSGDAMLIKSYEYLLKIQQVALVPEMIETFNQTALEVCEGQQYDMDFETRMEVTIPEYLRMIELKTAVLFACSIKMGARIGGASEKDAQLLYDFGRLSGIAFQLQDDILDTFGDPEKFGKKVGGDIAQNKKTYLVLKALELGNQEQINRLRNLMQTTPEDEAAKIEAVKALFEELNVREAAEAVMNDYREQSCFASTWHAVRAPAERKRSICESLAD